MKDLSNTNPQQPRKSCMQEPVTKEKKKKERKQLLCKLRIELRKKVTRSSTLKVNRNPKR